MTKRRKEQIRRRVFVFLWILFCALCFWFPHIMDPYLEQSNSDTEVDDKTEAYYSICAGVSAEDFESGYSVEEDTQPIVQAADTEYLDEEDEWVYPNENEELLASIIYYEAGNCCYETKLLVASVIINRMNSNDHDWKDVNTVEDVVSQHRVKNGKTYWQYSTFKKAKESLRSNSESRAAARYVLQYGSYDTKPLYQHYGRYVKDTTPYLISDTEYFSY